MDTLVNTSFTFYKNNIPFEYPQWFKGTWSSGSKPTITATPFTGHILFIKEMGFVMSQDFEISVGSMRVKHSNADGSNQYLQFDFETSNELLAASHVTGLFAHPTGTNEVHGHLPFDPPIKLRKSGNQTLTISDNATVTIVGTIEFVLKGWSMTETNYDEVS